MFERYHLSIYGYLYFIKTFSDVTNNNFIQPLSLRLAGWRNKLFFCTRFHALATIAKFKDNKFILKYPSTSYMFVLCLYNVKALLLEAVSMLQII